MCLTLQASLTHVDSGSLETAEAFSSGRSSLRACASISMWLKRASLKDLDSLRKNLFFAFLDRTDWLTYFLSLFLSLSPPPPPPLYFLSVCQIMSKGVVAVLGPSASPASNSIISNICGEKEVSSCTQLARSRWPMLGSALTLRAEFGTMMLISRCACFVGDWEGNEVLVSENDEIP